MTRSRHDNQRIPVHGMNCASSVGRVRDIDARIRELDGVRTTLMDLAARCHGDERPDCPIISGLSAGRER